MGRPKRHRLGQNFLVDRGIAERIVSLLADEPPRIVEIGPGRGALTAPLLDRFEKVRALELDPGLMPDLEQRFAGRGLELRLADALHDPLQELTEGVATCQVASNLPYSVGTAILRRLLPRHDLFTRVVVMLQREVARRIVARPGDREHGLLALERAARAEASLAFDVDPRAFRPAPKVVSSVVVLDPRPTSHESGLLDKALGLASNALTKPRKMLANALGPQAEASSYEAAGLDPRTRPGTLSLEAWIALARAISSNG